MFNEKSVVPDSDEEGCAYEFQAQLQEDAPCPILLARTHATLSLFDIARYQTTKRRSKGTTNTPHNIVTLLSAHQITARSGPDDFEVIRIPNVVTILEEEADLEDSWGLREWETFDVWGLKRTYSEVAQGFVDGKDPPNTPGCSRLVSTRVEDDSWECL